MKRFLDAATPQARPAIAMAALCALAVLAKGGGVAVAAPVELGVDRSNMGTQWTLAWPQEPKVSPFLTSDYNKPGNFEARRVAVMDGIARVHAGWFRDGFGKGSPDLSDRYAPQTRRRAPAHIAKAQYVETVHDRRVGALGWRSAPCGTQHGTIHADPASVKGARRMNFA